MFTKDASFEHETVNFEFAIATANRLRPAFVVITGDLINKGGDAAQAAEFQRISAKRDPKIRLFSIPGNHDVGNEPTAESLALYRERFGKDYHSFRIGDIAGFVLNSNLGKGVKNVQAEAGKMEAWFRAELAKAKQDGVMAPILEFAMASTGAAADACVGSATQSHLAPANYGA
jgi:predicted MPP superfamily phosphohydrolase